jgi:myo-inositol-1(or 4)-monophosphatase
MEQFIKEITKKAGAAILKKFGKVGIKYTKKDATDVVTEADLIANKIIIDAIKKKYPDHAIISEETGEYQVGAEYCWIIDPLDGTRNFSTRTPMFAVMVGLARNDEMKMATVYNPCANELFFAQKGKGAFLNNKRVHCSKQKTWKDSWGLISANLSERNAAVMDKLLKYSKKEIFWVSALGSGGVSAMYQANGRRDWRISRGGGLWDYAPTSLILSEAGCKVTNFILKLPRLAPHGFLLRHQPRRSRPRCRMSFFTYTKAASSLTI